MATKAELVSRILVELRKAQFQEWTPPPPGPVKTISFPPTLWLGDGRSLNVTELLLEAVLDYTRMCWENDVALKPRFKIDELNKLTQQSFGQVLAEIDLDASDEKLLPTVLERVAKLLREHISHHNRRIELILGCQIFDRDEPFPIQVGPVLFETRECWRQRMLLSGHLSQITARRLQKKWNGKTPKKRKPCFDESVERAVVNAIGGHTLVCTVITDGLSGKYVEEKGLLAARLAMTAISLIWQRPSEGLRWMNLFYDQRLPHRHTVMFGDEACVGYNSERVEFPKGRYVDTELINSLLSSQGLFDQVGEALSGYVQPKQFMPRVDTMNALLLSLLWYHQACREPLHQIATTKFAASMDALAGGGGAPGIINLISARLGHKPDGPLMKDGRTTKSVIAKIYETGRSKLIHGSSVDFAHDWTQVRQTAEAVGRLLLIECCDWLAKNPEASSIKELSR